MSKLIEIQNELKVPKGNLNKFGNYKYRSAEDILESAKPILLKHRATLIVTDDIIMVGSKTFLRATTNLSIGEEKYSTNGFAELGEHKGMSSEQCTGTASSYARKYALNGLFLIDETEADADSLKKENTPIKANVIDSYKEGLGLITRLEELEAYYNENKAEVTKSKELIKLFTDKKLELQKS